jgi:hypothetical protein
VNDAKVKTGHLNVSYLEAARWSVPTHEQGFRSQLHVPRLSELRSEDMPESPVNSAAARCWCGRSRLGGSTGELFVRPRRVFASVRRVF